MRRAITAPTSTGRHKQLRQGTAVTHGAAPTLPGHRFDQMCVVTVYVSFGILPLHDEKHAAEQHAALNRNTKLFLLEYI